MAHACSLSEAWETDRGTAHEFETSLGNMAKLPSLTNNQIWSMIYRIHIGSDKNEHNTLDIVSCSVTGNKKDLKFP